MSRTPKSMFLIAFAVTAVCMLVSGMIGQNNDGPWGGLPEWVGAVTWFGFLIGVLVTLVLGIYWLMQSMRSRKSAADTE